MLAIPLAAAILFAPQKPHKRPKPTDHWDAPIPHIYGGAEGQFALKVTPISANSANGVLFSIGQNGEENTVWNHPLQNIPVEVYISPLGHVATIDNWGGKGKQHALVIYDRTGKTVADYPFRILFPDTDPRRNTFILVTPSSNHWTINADIGYYDPMSVRQWSTTDLDIADKTETGYLFRIKTAWNETLLLDPDTGKILARQKKPN